MVWLKGEDGGGICLADTTREWVAACEGPAYVPNMTMLMPVSLAPPGVSRLTRS